MTRSGLLAATALRSVFAEPCRNGSTALLVNEIFEVGLNLTRLVGHVQSTSRAICTASPRTLPVEHEPETAVPTEIADSASP